MQDVARVLHRSSWSVQQILASMRDQFRLSRGGDAGPWTRGRQANAAEQHGRGGATRTRRKRLRLCH